MGNKQNQVKSRKRRYVHLRKPKIAPKDPIKVVVKRAAPEQISHLDESSDFDENSFVSAINASIASGSANISTSTPKRRLEFKTDPFTPGTPSPVKAQQGIAGGNVEAAVLPALSIKATMNDGAGSSQSAAAFAPLHLTVNVEHFTAALEGVFDHKSICSKKGRMDMFSSTTKSPTVMLLSFKCTKCRKVMKITTHPDGSV